MCELFGVSAKQSFIVNEYLKEFYSHSGEHPHGWGLACLDGNEAVIEKEPVQASKSSYLRERLTIPVCVKTGFAHIRYATVGNVEYKNCHPYTKKDSLGRRWTLNHNGTIFEYQPINKYVSIQTGDTDSERMLLYIIDRVDELEKKLGRRASAEERFRLIDSIVVEMSKGNKLNMMLFDEELFYVHTNYAHSLHKLEKEDQAIFSTQPLSDEDWEPMIFNTLVAYRQGREIFRGTTHAHEYIESEENLKFLYGIFSDL